MTNLHVYFREIHEGSRYKIFEVSEWVITQGLLKFFCNGPEKRKVCIPLTAIQLFWDSEL